MSRRRNDAWQLYLGVLLVSASLLIGLLQWWGVDLTFGEGDRTSGPAPTSFSPSPTPSPTDDPSDDPSDDPALTPRIVEWGGSGDQVVVVLRNQGTRTIRRAQVSLIARDADGQVVARAQDGALSTCCTVVGLPPGQEFGIFADLTDGARASDVADVDVRYEAITFGPSGWTVPRVEVSDVRLRRTPSDAVVEATLSLTGDRAAWRGLTGYVAGQAFLADRSGELVGVISGRFYCFTAAAPRRRIAMELQRTVPAGTRVTRVVAYPVAAAAGLPARRSCPSTVGGPA